MAQRPRDEPQVARVERSRSRRPARRTVAAVEGRMSQSAVELTLGKLLMDARFRDAFFEDPAATSNVAELDLTESELDGLRRIRPGAFAAFRKYLDGKTILVRASALVIFIAGSIPAGWTSAAHASARYTIEGAQTRQVIVASSDRAAPASRHAIEIGSGGSLMRQTCGRPDIPVRNDR
jgi:hypothetical protein